MVPSFQPISQLPLDRGVGGASAEKQLRTLIEAEMPPQKKLTDENPETAGRCKEADSPFETNKKSVLGSILVFDSFRALNGSMKP